ncbi:hypothetical protein PpBr36_00078 [Pyricularia pennisetigena]|uniref:hypothetical protein n=1 Tax=Pyricularia pennisetigena TaxID=1578925 RepID=UPI001153F8EC|nr:hypothetical protein PpBr36_00078 [Pyricularia pennisetigena]TLS28088.1 hypothetical protein PpBr36_00078 [Pyricularia pennisetigena]
MLDDLQYKSHAQRDGSGVAPAAPTYRQLTKATAERRPTTYDVVSYTRPNGRSLPSAELAVGSPPPGVPVVELELIGAAPVRPPPPEGGLAPEVPLPPPTDFGGLSVAVPLFMPLLPAVPFFMPLLPSILPGFTMAVPLFLPLSPIILPFFLSPSPIPAVPLDLLEPPAAGGEMICTPLPDAAGGGVLAPSDELELGAAAAPPPPWPMMMTTAWPPCAAWPSVAGGAAALPPSLLAGLADSPPDGILAPPPQHLDSPDPPFEPDSDFDGMAASPAILDGGEDSIGADLWPLDMEPSLPILAGVEDSIAGDL